MVENSVYAVEGSQTKKSSFRLVASAVVFFAGLAIATACNLGGYTVAAICSGLVALVSLVLFLGALRSDR